MIATVVHHYNHNQIRLTGWTEYSGRPEPSQVDNDARNMQWVVKELMNKNNDEYLATKLQSGITIWAVSDVSYHPTYQYGTSAWIIKI